MREHAHQQVGIAALDGVGVAAGQRLVSSSPTERSAACWLRRGRQMLQRDDERQLEALALLVPRFR